MIHVVKISMKIATHLSANVRTYATRARFIFSTGKNMATPSEHILQMVTYFHAGSHIKPWRVEMQMRAGRKGHKNNEHQSLRAFCLGQELVRWEAVISLRRPGEENSWIHKGGFWLVIVVSFIVERCNYNSTRHKLFWHFLQWRSNIYQFGNLSGSSY